MRREKIVREALQRYLEIHKGLDLYHKAGEGLMCHVCTRINVLRWVLGEREDV